MISLLIFLELMLRGGDCSTQERWHLQQGKWLSMGILAADSSALSPEPPTSDSPHMALVYSALPLPEPREVSGSKWNFVHWPFKRLSVSLAISPWWSETPLLFTARWYLGSTPGSGALGGESSLRFSPHTSQGEPPCHWNIPLELQTLPVWAQPALSHLHTSYQSRCGKVISSVSPWFKASLQLVFSWLFRMTFL